MAMKSWVLSANVPASDFPLENLPYGAFRRGEAIHLGVAIGDQILDLHEAADGKLLDGLAEVIVDACRSESLNLLMSLGRAAWRQLRGQLMNLLDAERAAKEMQGRVQAALVLQSEVAMLLPAHIGDYTDFYASIDHATRVGKLFRPDNPLLPNYKYVPIGYHGRASSIVISGQDVRRPSGQIKPPTGPPVFGPAQQMDYELEVGAFVGPGNRLGDAIPIAEAEKHLFGLCLLNDWSARDVQAWEYQPLGPFLAKNFATTISPWVVTLEALEPFRVPQYARAADDPAPLSYLCSPFADRDGIDLALEVLLRSQRMREANVPAVVVARSNLRHLYWSLAQLLTHHASGGCNLRPGDLLATGTVSGPEAGSEGCLLEKRHNREPLQLPGGEFRSFLEDGDQVTLRAYAQRDGSARIGFGECSGVIRGCESLD